jgi:glycosyltransferase involved in cell wall biosynthesis
MAGSDGGESMLSVITPSLNSARYLGETLDSVSALTVPHEHVVVDGGSTDGTIELLEGRDDPALVWSSGPDGGQTQAVNLGFDRARGDLLAWLNADDAYVPENVDAAIGLLREDPDLDAVFGFMEIVDESGAARRRYRCGPFSWRRYLYFGEYLPTPTLIFRRSLVDREGGLDEGYADAADYDFYLRILRGASVRRVKEPLVRFRYHDASKTGSNVGVQRREALAVRLRYARVGPERWLMRGAERAHRLRNAIVSPWPELPGER